MDTKKACRFLFAGEPWSRTAIAVFAGLRAGSFSCSIPTFRKEITMSQKKSERKREIDRRRRRREKRAKLRAKGLLPAAKAGK
jgi:hypothetical protein